MDRSFQDRLPDFRTSPSKDLDLSDVSRFSYLADDMPEPDGTVDMDQTLGDVSTIFTSNEGSGKKALNWKKYLRDEKVALDALKFQKSRKSPVEEHPGIYKDLPRTRPDDPYFQKPSNINALREIACFYCSTNNINYQQGLLEMIVPFLKLRSATFRTKQCYAYFASFMRNYFPNILIPTVVNDLKELPHLNAAINYCGLLLDYHGNKISNILKEKDLDLRTFVTPWVMTLFCKGTPMDLVYELFDRYMAEKDKLFLFYMVVALILMRKDEIISIYDGEDEVKLIMYLNRSLKEECIQTTEDLDKLFDMAKLLKRQTPLSFETSLKQLGLMDVGILSIQEFNEYLSQNVQSVMEIFPFEIVNYIVEKSNKDRPNNARIEFKLLDCRKSKKGVTLPYSIELPESAFKSHEALKAFLTDVCRVEEATHICILTTDNFNKEEQKFVAAALKIVKSLNKNYMSIVLGGYQAILKDTEQRKINMSFLKRKKVSLFDKLKTIFS